MPTTLIARAKISDESARQVVWGFASGLSKARIAAASGLSEKTVQSVLLALRSRLFNPAFYRWKDPGAFFLTYDVEYQEIVDRAVYGVLAACYFNKRCFSNYRQELRAARICRGCPAKMIFEDDAETLEQAVAFLDTIHDFYDHLGIGAERGKDETDVVRLRWYHVMVVRDAVLETRLLPDNAPEFDDNRPRTCRALYEALLRELKETPLERWS